MHTTDRTQAEGFRIALLARGIEASIEEGAAYSLPTRYVVRVAPADQAAAETVRTQLEAGWVNAPSHTLPVRVVLLVMLIVAALFWLLWHGSGR